MIRRRRRIRSRRVPRAPTTSSSAASGRTRRSRTAAGSPSGSSPTTSERAPPRMPCRSPSFSSSAAGSGAPPPAARPRTDAQGRPSGRVGDGDRTGSVTSAERQAALDAIAAEVSACTNCRLAATRTRSVPGEGNADTEVVFVGEGPGFNEDRQGRPFVGRAGDLLGKLLTSIEWPRGDVFITNVVKCRPPDNRDPEPDEIAACAPYLRRQLEVIDPALVVTLGRHSMARFVPNARISQVHGTTTPVDPGTGARDATVL